MPLDQYVRLDSYLPYDIGFFYSGVPEAGTELGSFTYRFPIDLYINSCTLNANTPSLSISRLYLTLDHAVIAHGNFVGAAIGAFYPTDASTSVVTNASGTVRLIAPDEVPDDETLFNIRATIAGLRLATTGDG